MVTYADSLRKLEHKKCKTYIFKVKLKFLNLSLRTRITAVVVLILFAAGILVTYFNSLNAEKMEFHDSEKDAQLLAAEFNLTTSLSPESDTQALVTKAKLALRLNSDAEFIGFFKAVKPDSVLLIASAGKSLSDSEISYAKRKLENTLVKDVSTSSIISGSSLFSYSRLLNSDGKLWGYVLIKISFKEVHRIVSRYWVTGIEMTLAICVFSSVLLLFAMRLTFLRPFEDLEKAMRKAAEGNLNARLSIISGTEFKTLSSIFNEMMSELQKADEIVRSEFKMQEEFNARLQREVADATETLREKSDEVITLQEKLRTFESQAALGKIAAKLAHEIGSPLNAIYTSVQLLLENDIDEEVKTKLKVIERQVDTMIKIINQLLQARKIAVPSKRSVVLKNLIEETRLVMESRLKGKPIDLNIQLEDPFAKINADPVQIQQVLINLFNNSIEAIESRKKNGTPGNIELKVYEDYDLRVSGFGFPNLRFDVSDNGNGVPEELLSQIFNDFIDSKKPNGNGIGLVICEEIVDRHGGKIFLARNSDNGSTFSVILPTGETDVPLS